jgi:CubicO group peptidase (beta-lactamase class C family)
VDTIKQARPELTVSDPAEAGFDPKRLARVDTHLRRYVDDGRLAGWQVLVSRRGKPVLASHYGQRDKEAGLPVESDTLFRIYSMTKPITSVAIMMLLEEGAFELTTPVHRFIPSFKDVRVYVRGSAAAPLTVPATEPVRIWHLLTHTSGLTYGFFHSVATDEAYRTAGFEWAWPDGMDLAAACDTWASLPLSFQPGMEWNYGVSTDVLGRIVEVVSGQSLDQFFRERIFAPLGMTDTAFWAATEADLERLAALYAIAPGLPGPVRYDPLGKYALSRPSLFSGGGGLVSTAADYHRFCRMIMNRGELDGVRLLAPRTVAAMSRNHLPGGADLEEFGRPIYAEMTFLGTGFGLGFAVVDDPIKAKSWSNRGEISWGGAASTAFWIDPVDEVICIFMTQLLPSSTHPVRSELRQLVYQALID